jgi:LuxR family maltose regulon positive regulatory protein
VGRGTRPRRRRPAELPARARIPPPGQDPAAQGQAERARGLLERLHVAAAAQQRTGSLVGLGGLRARALAASGDQPGALAALAGALTLAWREGYVRVLADEGPPLAALLDQLIAGHGGAAGTTSPGVPREYLGRLQAAFRPGGDRPTQPAASPSPRTAAWLGEPLTDRELEVLALLAAGAANQQIADELVVALETVKKHVSHILGKLDAASRTQAVARAREFGLLP